MKISLNWIKDYADFTAPPEEISRAITFLGFEVEGIVRSGAPALEHVVVGEVLERKPHPNAERLSVCQVDIGAAGGVKTIVCGAQNYQVGDRVPVALPGAILPGNFAIKQSKIRGELSDGMMCSGRSWESATITAACSSWLAGRRSAPPSMRSCRPAMWCSTSKSRPTGRIASPTWASPASWRPGLTCRCATPAPVPAPTHRHGALAIPANLLAGIAVEAPEDCPPTPRTSSPA